MPLSGPKAHLGPKRVLEAQQPGRAKSSEAGASGSGILGGFGPSLGSLAQDATDNFPADAERRRNRTLAVALGAELQHSLG